MEIQLLKQTEIDGLATACRIIFTYVAAPAIAEVASYIKTWFCNIVVLVKTLVLVICYLKVRTLQSIHLVQELMQV